MAGTVIRFSIAAPGVETVTATHIHHGAAGVNGPMVWEINPGFKGDSVRGAAQGIPPGLIAGIAREPAEYYVKLHTRQFPGGAIRGQLAPCPAGETILSNEGKKWRRSIRTPAAARLFRRCAPPSCAFP